MEDGKVVHFEPKKSEAEIAADLKARFHEAVKPVLAVMDEALSNGMEIQFNGVAPAPVKYQVINVRVVKHF